MWQSLGVEGAKSAGGTAAPPGTRPRRDGAVAAAIGVMKSFRFVDDDDGDESA